MKQQYETVLVLVIKHDKPIPDLSDMAADRVYRMEAVSDVEVKLLMQKEAQHG